MFKILNYYQLVLRH